LFESFKGAAIVSTGTVLDKKDRRFEDGNIVDDFGVGGSF
jgi:hypothetical protein